MRPTSALEPPLQVTAWVALTDASIEAGCMEVIPGSHKLGQQQPECATLDSSCARCRSLCEPGITSMQPASIEASVSATQAVTCRGRLEAEVGRILVPAHIGRVASVLGPDREMEQTDIRTDHVLDGVEDGGMVDDLVDPGKTGDAA